MVSRTCALLLLASCAGSTAIAQAPESSAPLRRWIDDLGADEFVARERATLALVDAGRPAIAPVVGAIRGGDLEVVARGVHVLRALTLSDDAEVAQPAEQALRTVADEGPEIARRRAQEALDQLAEARRARAIARLRANGIKEIYMRKRVGLKLIEEVYAIQIDEDWLGRVEDLEQLAYLDEFPGLVFVGPKVTDQWLDVVTRLPHVRALKLRHTSVTAAGLEKIKQLFAEPNAPARLEQLSIWYTPIGDDALEHFRKMRLMHLELYGTNVTREAAERLGSELAATQIHYKLGAFLGVGGVQNELGCEISVVHPNSAAERAGLRALDIITHYDGQPVDTFDTLTEIIAKNRVGDTVEVRFVRGIEKRVCEVTLGEWKD